MRWYCPSITALAAYLRVYGMWHGRILDLGSRSVFFLDLRQVGCIYTRTYVCAHMGKFGSRVLSVYVIHAYN